METLIPLSSFSGEDSEVTEEDGDFQVRKLLAYADLHTEAYQLQKLKFIAYARLSVGSVKDAESASDLYNSLVQRYCGDEEAATADLNAILKVAGLDLPDYLTMRASSLISGSYDDDEFIWRRNLIKYSDRAVKQKNVSRKFMSYLHDTYGVEETNEDFSYPIEVFEHLIERRLMKKGDLRNVEKFFSIRKSQSRATLFFTAVSTTSLPPPPHDCR